MHIFTLNKGTKSHGLGVGEAVLPVLPPLPWLHIQKSMQGPGRRCLQRGALIQTQLWAHQQPGDRPRARHVSSLHRPTRSRSPNHHPGYSNSPEPGSLHHPPSRPTSANPVSLTSPPRRPPPGSSYDTNPVDTRGSPTFTAMETELPLRTFLSSIRQKFGKTH